MYRGHVTTSFRCLAAVLLLAHAACSSRVPDASGTPAAEYLYLWTASADSTQPDFLAVLDVTEVGAATDGW